MPFSINKISKTYGELNVLADISFKIDNNKIVSLLGPSGCGKTTLLNIFSGITTPDAGNINGFSADKISYLFQEPRLLKWKTIEENIDFVLKDKMGPNQRNEVIRKNLEIVDLWEYRKFYPSQLSGGMKQRVAIARAFAFPAPIMLMDEPFKSLDLDLKASLIKSFTALWRVDRRSVFFVTHDIHAAIILGDEIFVLSEKPTYIQKQIKNKVALADRNLRNPDILEIEKQLYDYFSYFR